MANTRVGPLIEMIRSISNFAFKCLKDSNDSVLTSYSFFCGICWIFRSTFITSEYGDHKGVEVILKGKKNFKNVTTEVLAT